MEPASHRPLVHLIPDNHHYDLDVSDEEDAFYQVDEGDSLLSPKWRALIHRTSNRVNRIPRRLQRYIIIYVLAFVLFLVVWFTLLGPKYSAYMQETWDMDANPASRWGLNKKPEFKDMVQVKKLDPKWLPRGDRRLVVVGDVHGCKKELEELLKKLDFKENHDHLVLTGDIISKGPDSPGVVSLASRLGASCVRGNHEDRILLSLATMAESASLKDTDPVSESISHGDLETRKLARSFSRDQITYLQSLPVILDVGTIGTLTHVAVVHAGLVPDIALEDQDPFQVMNMRSIVLKTRLPSETREGNPWEQLWNHVQKKKPKHERMNVIYGHDRKTGLNIQKWSYGLDSGCVSGGNLTAMVIAESGAHDFVSVGCKGYV